MAKLNQKTRPQLIKLADTHWSRYVRLRDSAKQADGAWVGKCIDCDKDILVMAEGRWSSGANCGHFVGRSCMLLRYDEENTNLQSAHCNAWRDKLSMLEGYEKGLDLKYGDGTAKRLKAERHVSYKHSKEELIQVIHDAKEYVAYMLANPDKYSRL